MKIYKPKTIEEAIESLGQFLECDLYSKFNPIEEISGEEWCRKDYFRNEEEFIKYLREHFDILLKQIEGFKELNIYLEQRTFLHEVYMDLISYSCAKHQKLRNKIQNEIEILDEVIEYCRKFEVPKEKSK